MIRKNISLYISVVFVGAFAFIFACSDDHIPNSPNEPFLFTDIEISNDVIPIPGTIFTAGQLVSFDFKVAYTLAPEEVKKRDDIVLFIDFLAFDALSDSFLVSSQIMFLSANSDIFKISPSVDIPGINVSTQQNVRRLVLCVSLFNIDSFEIYADDRRVWGILRVP
ncbi:MAG: hypothetical protein ACE5HI_00995 [bacterium]